MPFCSSIATCVGAFRFDRESISADNRLDSPRSLRPRPDAHGCKTLLSWPWQQTTVLDLEIVPERGAQHVMRENGNLFGNEL